MRILALGDFHGNFSDKLYNRLKKEEFDIVIGVGDYGGIKGIYPYVKYMFKYSAKGKRVPKNMEEFFGKKKFKELMREDRSSTKQVLSRINSLGKKAILIFGNSDNGWYKPITMKKRLMKPSSLKEIVRNLKICKKFKNFKNINYGSTSYNKINFIGFGGYLDIKSNWNKGFKKQYPKSYDNMIKRNEIMKTKFFKILENKKIDIMVLHYPPKGVFDIISDKTNPYYGKSAGIDFFREGIIKKKPRIVLCGHMHEYQGMKKIGKSMIINPGESNEGRYAIIDYSKKIKIKFFK